MFEIALVSSSRSMAKKIAEALSRVAFSLICVDNLSQLANAKETKKLDLIVVHHPPESLSKELTLDTERRLINRTPVIAIIPNDRPEWSVPLLNAGIDRCMLETFDESHFSAVVRALTRRGFGLTSTLSQYGALTFNHHTKQVWVQDEELELTKREAQILDVLLRRVGQIISKEDFIKAIDPCNIELNTSAVEVYIHRLRKKIKNDLLPIRSIKRCGYFLRRFEQPISTASFSFARRAEMQHSFSKSF